MINFTPQQPNLAMIARSTGSGSSVKVRIADGKYTNERAYDYSYTLCSKPRDNYRFGFNGQEKVNEVAGLGNHNTALFWEYDTRLGRRWNLDPVPNASESPYAAFGDNPIYNKDPLGNVIAPWWLPSSPGDKIPGYGGGVSSPFKNFLTSNDLNDFNHTAIQLYRDNDIFRKTTDRLQASKTVYHVQQKYETSAVGMNANYSRSSKTISFGYFGISKSELFEETFHAGQDDYYSEKGISRSSLANEVEAKVANIISGFQDESVKSGRDYSSIKNYFKTGEKGEGFDKALDNLIGDTYQVYKKAKGDDWGKANDPSTVDRATVLKYLETTTGVTDGKK